MKDKDPNEDEFNQDEQDNINEADDSFGLPDLDFSTVEEASDQASEEEAAETVPEPEEPTDEVDSTPDEEEPTEDEPEVTADSDEQAHEDDIAEDENQEEDSPEDSDQEESAEEAEVVGKSTYVPPKPESNAPKLVIALLVTLVVSVGIWYFMFYRPQAKDAEKVATELADKKAAEAKKAADAKKKEQQRLEKERADAAAAAAAEEKSIAEATFSTISEPTGRYYIVVQSFIDNDMANDLGKKMAADGVSTALLVPKGKKKFNRLTIAGDYGSYVEAQEEANKLKPEFGDGLWVVKY